MGRGNKFKGKPTGHRQFSTLEEMVAGSSSRPHTFKKKKDEFKAEESQEESGEESDDEQNDKRKGTQGLIEIENPNRVKPKTLKAKDIDIGKTTELSRREREEIEKQRAREHYMRLQERGKTEQPRKDLAVSGGIGGNDLPISMANGSDGSGQPHDGAQGLQEAWVAIQEQREAIHNLEQRVGSDGSGQPHNCAQGLQEAWVAIQEQREATHNLAQRVEQQFTTLTEQLNNLLQIVGDRRGNANLPPAEGVAQGRLVNRYAPINHRTTELQDWDDSEEDEKEFELGAGRYGGERYDRNQNGELRGEDEFKLRVDIPTFSGDLMIEQFLDWVSEVDRFFDYMEIEAPRRVKLVAFHLKGSASVWWDRLQVTRRREGRGPVRTWERMKQLLRGRFLPLDYEQYLFRAYQRCAQGNKSVHEYTTEFLRLAERNQLTESDNQQAARYLDGLRPAIRDKIGVQMVMSVSEARNLALKAELMLQDRGRYDNYRCFNSGEGNSRVAADRGKCGDCPRRKVVNVLAHDDDEEGEAVYCAPDGEEENNGNDDCEGETYVVRKLMLSQKHTDESQRNKLFKTRCTILGKLFNLIIDGGSQENLISKEVVQKLQLKPEKHPNPYEVGCT